MVRNLRKNKKMPIAFYLSHGAVASGLLKQIISDAIEKLIAIGMNIKAIVCDQSSTNCRLFTLLGIEQDHILKFKEKEYLLFMIHLIC